MMLTEQEVSEIMKECIMTIEISRNLENSGFRSGSSDERIEEIMVVLEVQI